MLTEQLNIDKVFRRAVFLKDYSGDEMAIAALSLIERLRRTDDALARVMHTLSFSAASPADQAIYDEARALLAEHGRVGVPQEMVEAHREWEGRR
jgi:hypothetical protein